MRAPWTVVAGALLACASPPPDQLARCPTGPVGGVEIRSPDPTRGDPERGAGLFARECSRCHSPLVIERESRLFRGYPRLDCADYLDRASDAYLATVIAEGGEAVGLAKAMKPFGDRLSPAEVADLIAYLRRGGAPPMEP